MRYSKYEWEYEKSFKKYYQSRFVNNFVSIKKFKYKIDFNIKSFFIYSLLNNGYFQNIHWYKNGKFDNEKMNVKCNKVIERNWERKEKIILMNVNTL